MPARRGWRGPQTLKIPPSCDSHVFHSFTFMSQGEMAVSPHPSACWFSQVAMLRTIPAGREAEPGSGKSASGTWNSVSEGSFR